MSSVATAISRTELRQRSHVTDGRESELRPLRIWHDGAEPVSIGVNGVNATIWLLARHQAQLGHDVTLLIRERPSAAAVTAAQAWGIQLLFLGGGKLRVSERRFNAALASNPPDLVHMHSVFIPRQASLARCLAARGVPYITTPHGGLSSEVLKHNRLKKQLYARLLERPRCNASDIVTASIGEETDIRRFLGHSDVPIRTMQVGIDCSALGKERWNQKISARKLVFLGRFDVYVKGIDLLLAIAGLMRDCEFHLYGVQDQATRRHLYYIRQGCGENVYFHPPVYGRDKAEVLCDASMYIQMSRSESFGISIAEAMYLGVPCAISEQIHLANAFRENDLGLLLPTDPPAASMALTRALANPARLLHCSERAREFAKENFDPAGVAQRHIELYREIVQPYVKLS